MVKILKKKTAFLPAQYTKKKKKKKRKKIIHVTTCFFYINTWSPKVVWLQNPLPFTHNSTVQREDEVSPRQCRRLAASMMMTEIFLPVARHVLLSHLITVYSCSSCLLKLLSSPLTCFPSLHLSLLVLFMQQIPLCRERMGHYTPINTVHESTSLSTKQWHNRAVSRPTFHTALQITLNGEKKVDLSNFAIGEFNIQRTEKQIKQFEVRLPEVD